MQNEHNNFLIVTASIGAGHNRAAQAIAAEIKAENPTAKIHIVDFRNKFEFDSNAVVEIHASVYAETFNVSRQAAHEAILEGAVHPEFVESV